MQARKYFWLIALINSLFLVNNFANQPAMATESEFQTEKNGGAKSRIIASFYNQNGQEKLIAGFEIKLAEGWKIYAPDKSGVSSLGIAPYFNLENSKNIDLKKFNPIFPQSEIEKEQIGDENIEYNVYKKRTIIPIELEVLNIGQKSTLEIQANYGLCKEICIPASQKFSLEIASLNHDKKVLEEIQKFLDNKQIALNNIDEQIQKPLLTTNQNIKISLIRALFLAFIGGAILNIMPCVLPVLSLKLLSIIDHNKIGSKISRLSFFATTSGIVFSFIIFALTAITIKYLGASIGWGFQFQNPYFLLFLLIILMIFIANLLGMFEIRFGSSLGSILNNKINQKLSSEEHHKNIFVANFFSGVLAVLLATPCSAPFVGVAISFALGSGYSEIALIFITMSFGFALPYLVLMIFPSAVKILPKPGIWMVKAKQIMAGFLMATAIWLLYILMDNIGVIASIVAAFLITLILLFFKVIKKINFGSNDKNIGKKFISIIALMAIIASIFIIPNCLSYLNKVAEIQQQKEWIKFDQSQINGLVNDGKVVFIDITADWCITCKANKALVLDSKEIKTKLSGVNIIKMRGDLTKPNQEIFEFMKKYNRYGIPFNMVFGPSAPQGILISELLNKNAIIKAIDQATKEEGFKNKVSNTKSHI